MGILSRAIGGVLEARARLTVTSGMGEGSSWLLDAPTSAGVPINNATALNYSAVWAAVALISETVASLPWVAQRVTAEGYASEPTHPVLRILNVQPNPEQLPYAFRELQTARALMWGNAPAEIQRRGNGQPAWLWPIHPSRVHPARTAAGELVYEIDQPQQYADGSRPTQRKTLPARDLFNVRFKGDGIWGQSIIGYARESIGLGVAAERFGASLFSNRATPGGLVEVPNALSPKQLREWQDEWAMTTGPENAHKVKILTRGATWRTTGIPPEDAQFLQTRKFQVSEVARWFGVPPHMLADLEKATFSNIEEQGLDFIRRLLPWLLRWEQEAEAKLVEPAQLGLVVFDHLVEQMLRADVGKRGTWYAQMRQWGAYSANDIRRAERLEPVEGGDVYLTPANMQDAAAVGVDPAGAAPDAGAAAGGVPITGPGGGAQQASANRAAVLKAAGKMLHAATVRALSKEASELAAAAAAPKRWLERVEAFYKRQRAKYQADLVPVAAMLAEVGLVFDPVAEARDYCTAGLASWVEWSGQATASGLVEQVDRRSADRRQDILREVSSWHALRSQDAPGGDAAAA